MLSFNPSIAVQKFSPHTPEVEVASTLAATQCLSLPRRVYSTAASADGSILVVTIGDASTTIGAWPWSSYNNGEVRIYSVVDGVYTLIKSQTRTGTTMATNNFGFFVHVSSDGSRVFIGNGYDFITLSKSANTFNLDSSAPVLTSLSLNTSNGGWLRFSKGDGNACVAYDSGAYWRLDWNGTAWVRSYGISSFTNMDVEKLDENLEYIIVKQLGAGLTSMPIVSWDGSAYVAYRTLPVYGSVLDAGDLSKILIKGNYSSGVSVIQEDGSLVNAGGNRYSYTECVWTGSTYVSSTVYSDNMVANLFTFGQNRNFLSSYFPPSTRAATSSDSSYLFITYIRALDGSLREENSVTITGCKPQRQGDVTGGDSTYQTVVVNSGRIYMLDRSSVNNVYFVDIPHIRRLI